MVVIAAMVVSIGAVLAHKSRTQPAAAAVRLLANSAPTPAVPRHRLDTWYRRPPRPAVPADRHRRRHARRHLAARLSVGPRSAFLAVDRRDGRRAGSRRSPPVGQPRLSTASAVRSPGGSTVGNVPDGCSPVDEGSGESWPSATAAAKANDRRRSGDFIQCRPARLPGRRHRTRTARPDGAGRSPIRLFPPTRPRPTSSTCARRCVSHVLSRSAHRRHGAELQGRGAGCHPTGPAISFTLAEASVSDFTAFHQRCSVVPSSRPTIVAQHDLCSAVPTSSPWSGHGPGRR